MRKPQNERATLEIERLAWVYGFWSGVVATLAGVLFLLAYWRIVG